MSSYWNYRECYDNETVCGGTPDDNDPPYDPERQCHAGNHPMTPTPQDTALPQHILIQISPSRWVVAERKILNEYKVRTIKMKHDRAQKVCDELNDLGYWQWSPETEAALLDEESES